LSTDEKVLVVRIDVSQLRCPMTWVRTKVALESLPHGGTLEVVLGGGEMRVNVPRNAAEAGHLVAPLVALDDGRCLLSIVCVDEER